MPLADIVRVNIAVLSAGITQAGFGIPLILSHSATWVERTRTYTSAAGVLADFAATTPEYLAAQAEFSQSPAPPKIMIGRSAVKPTQWHVFTVAAVSDSTAYSVRIGAQTATFTSGVGTTNDLIAAGLLAAINALAAPALGATATLTGAALSRTVTLTANAAGNWTGLEVVRTDLLSVAQTHADPGIATDLAAILNESQAWYALITLFNSKLYVAAAALWIEANERFYMADSQDTDIINVADSGASDIAHTLKAASYARTAVVYHPANDAWLAASWCGALLPLDPGSETWKFKTLATVPATVLTATQITNLKAKYCGWYYSINSKNITTEGKVAANEWIDVIRFRDWLKARMQERIFVRLTQTKKVPFTDKGLVVIEGEIRAQLADGVSVGGLADVPAPDVVMPLVATISPANKSARILDGITFSGTLAGAIHELTINGTISE